MSFDSSTNTGSILYELDPGANFRSFPFNDQYSITLSGSGLSSDGYYSNDINNSDGGITPKQLNTMFGNTLTGIITEGQAAQSMSIGWVGSLQKINSNKSYWLITTGSKFPAGASKVSGSITGSMINPSWIDNGNTGANAFANPYAMEIHITGGLNPAATGSNGINRIVGQGNATLMVNDSWVGSLTSFQPGKGYWFVVSSSANIWEGDPNIPVFQGYETTHPTASLDPTEGESSFYPLKYLMKETFYEDYGYSSNGNYLMPGYQQDPAWYRPQQSGSTYGSTFGHWQAMDQSLVHFKTSVDRSASLRDVDGESLHVGSSYTGPELGWFSQLCGTGSNDYARWNPGAGWWPSGTWHPHFYTGSAVYTNGDSASICFGASNWEGHPLGPTYTYSSNPEIDETGMIQNPNYIIMMLHFSPGSGINPLSWPTNALPDAAAIGKGDGSSTSTAGYGKYLYTKNAFKIAHPSKGVVPASLFCESGSGAWGEPHYLFLDSGQSAANEFLMFFNEVTGSLFGSNTYPFGRNSGSWSVDSNGWLVLSASRNAAGNDAWHFGECYVQAKI